MFMACLFIVCVCCCVVLGWLVCLYAKTRSTSSTSSNETSSRSHAILQINITKSGELSKLTFVDLAGSEWFDDSSSHDKEACIHIHIHMCILSSLFIANKPLSKDRGILCLDLNTCSQ
jgi:hypothetical protein